MGIEKCSMEEIWNCECANDRDTEHCHRKIMLYEQRAVRR